MRLTAAIAFFGTLPALAGPIPYTVPSSSGLKVVEDNVDFPYVAFTGVLRIRANYFVDCSTVCPSVTLRLSDEEAKNVPYFLKDEEALLPSNIQLKNDYEAALALVGEDRIKQLEDGRVARLAGEIEISLGNYFATYECDGPVYVGTFVSVDRVVVSPAETSEEISDTC